MHAGVAWQRAAEEAADLVTLGEAPSITSSRDSLNDEPYAASAFVSINDRAGLAGGSQYRMRSELWKRVEHGHWLS